MTAPAETAPNTSVIEQPADLDGTRRFELLDSIARPGDVALDVEPQGQGRWLVTLCTSDALGALSIIAGLFTAHGIDIRSADITTVHRLPDESRWPTLRHRPRRPSGSPAANRPVHLVLDAFQ